MVPAGAIWVGETTHRIAREAFEWQEVERQAVKGKTDAVPVYALHGPRTVYSRFEVVAQRGFTRFVGRYPELQQLLTVWEQTEQGAGRVVSVVGEALHSLMCGYEQSVIEGRDSPVEINLRAGDSGRQTSLPLLSSCPRASSCVPPGYILGRLSLF
jgi:hypothetical protein